MLESSDLLLWDFGRRSRCVTDAGGDVVATIDKHAPPDCDLVVRDPAGEVTLSLQRVRRKRWWGFQTAGYRVMGSDGRELGVLRDEQVWVGEESVARRRTSGTVGHRYEHIESVDGRHVASLKKASIWSGARFELRFVEPLEGDLRNLIAAMPYDVYREGLDSTFG